MMAQPRHIEGRVRTVVISGGGSGIGRATAARFVATGDDVFIVGRGRPRLEKASDELGGVTTVVADLSDPQGSTAVLEALGGRPVDVLVAAAGSSLARSPGNLDEIEQEWIRDYRANVLTTVLLEHAVRPYLVRPGGRVVAIGSIAGQIGSGYGGSYGAAKAALHAWMYSLARELGPDGVTVNLVLPGYIPDTEFFGDRIDEAFHDVRVRRTMVGRPGYADEVAGVVEFLASDDAAYMTAQLVGVSGGTVLGR
jgi:3-oxoacyl-[acyl-carrier protein] reductase